MEIDLVNVFTHQGAGGNPCPVALEASGMSDADMQAIARRYGHEASFVLPGDGRGHDFRFRFWVPRHEMEMCGHATVGALWLMAQKGRLGAGEARISTLSGTVCGYVAFAEDGTPEIEVSQPVGTATALAPEAAESVCKALRLENSDLPDLPIQNAATSRMKTLVPIRDADRLNAIAPDFALIKRVCSAIGSTGLYPYARCGDRRFEARQFPKSSGYPEDPATGIAAAALSFGLLANGLIEPSPELIRVLQGRAMGRLSEIRVRHEIEGGRAVGCRLGGAVDYARVEAERRAPSLSMARKP